MQQPAGVGLGGFFWGFFSGWRAVVVKAQKDRVGGKRYREEPEDLLGQGRNLGEREGPRREAREG